MIDKIKPYMNPYIAGVILGLVIISSFVFTGQGLGASGAIKDATSTAVIAASEDYANNSDYYHKAAEKEHSPLKSWLVFEIMGVIFGGVISGAMSGRLKLVVERPEHVSSKRRIIFAVLGGIFFGMGSQLARGCASGAGLTGMAVFSLSGFIAAFAMFGGGFLFAPFFRKLWYK